MTLDEIKRNIENVSRRIERAQDTFGRHVTLVAATKTVPADIVDFAVSCGVEDVGENRVQEFLDKRDAVTGAKWHFIGTLQSNKAKYLVGHVALIQSVNSERLAREIDRLAQKRNVVQDVLIEVNVGSEPTKTGVSADEAERLVHTAFGLAGVRVRGLMAVPPKDATDDVYRRLYDMYARMNAVYPYFDVLSVGMSADYERAIAFGSNMVRIGTAIFGSRTYDIRQGR